MVFTGIVQDVVRGRLSRESHVLTIDLVEERKEGESIALDGVCLTVLPDVAGAKQIKFFLQEETLRCTSFGVHLDAEAHKAEVELTMNLERAVKHGESYSGHLVLGHVHDIARLLSVEKHADGSAEMWVRLPACPQELQGGLFRKGCITLSGVSLTVAELREGKSGVVDCRVALIPYTLKQTTLQFLSAGDPLNVEFAPPRQTLLTPPATAKAADEAWMKQAIEIGEQGRLTAPPNPWIGCVIVDETGRSLLGSGFHCRAGEPHAEVMALADALNRWLEQGNASVVSSTSSCSSSSDNGTLNGLEEVLYWRTGKSWRFEGAGEFVKMLKQATVYVTLEPCHHRGRTPPCDRLLVAAGFKRVVVALKDPDPRVSGKGLTLLRDEGLDVSLFQADSSLAKAASESLAPYLHQRRLGMPFVVLKVAQSMDGRIACQDGTSQWITGQTARMEGHRLRALSQAVLVGSETALTDLPKLTVRHNVAPLHLQRHIPSDADAEDFAIPQPLRVVLDSRGRLRHGSLLEDAKDFPTLIFTTDASHHRGNASLWATRYPAVEVVEVMADSNGHCDLKACLNYLVQQKGILQLLVEGGATIINSFITDCSKSIGRFFLFTGSRLLGGSAQTWSHLALTQTIEDSEQFRWQAIRAEVLEDGDTVTEYKPMMVQIEGRLVTNFEKQAVTSTKTSGKDRRTRLTPVGKVVEAIAQGQMVVVMDAVDRENEADLIMGAKFATEAKVARMIRHTSGVLCAPMSQMRAKALQLPMMLAHNEDPLGTAFTITCDLKGTGTGISAASRAATFNALADPLTKGEHLQRPGHVFPLIGRDGLLHERGGHTEASLTLCHLAGLDPPVAVIGEMQKDDGRMMRLDFVLDLAERHGFPITTVEELRDHVVRLPDWHHLSLNYSMSSSVKKKASSSSSAAASSSSSSASLLSNDKESLPSPKRTKKSIHERPVLLADCSLPIERDGEDFGKWRLCCYSAPSPPLDQSESQLEQSKIDQSHIRIALIKGDLELIQREKRPITVRIHSACFTSEVLGSQRCECDLQLTAAMRAITSYENGIIIYETAHEGRGIGLIEKIKAYKLMELNSDLDTYTANVCLGHKRDVRDYRGAAEILAELGLSDVEITLLSNNPEKAKTLQSAGLSVMLTPFFVESSPYSSKYLAAKAKHGHLVPSSDSESDSSRSPSPSQRKKGSQQQQQPDLHYQPTFATPGKVPTTLAMQLAPSKISEVSVAIIRTQWNEHVVAALTKGVVDRLDEVSMKHQIFVCPGAYELPFTAKKLTNKFSAIIAIGVLVKGETYHFEYISESVSRGLMDVQLNTGVPVIYGVLNCMTLKQAEERAGIGADSLLAASWADAALSMIDEEGERRGLVKRREEL